ncbi:hypothetical protein TNCV_4307711 [Trichonephila clavipes]|nr:hypothetical protein TNCV_4307711 [Trichonephila clavipes]
MGREDVPQSTKRSNEAERRRGEGKNAGRKAERPKAANQDGEISPKNPDFHAEIVEVEIGGVAIYGPFWEFRQAKSYCHLYGAQGQRQTTSSSMPR